MKKLKLAIVLMIGLSVIAVFGQQKPLEPKPVTLSLEASQQWMEAQRQINELQLKIDNLRLQQTVIALGEGVPKGYVVGGRDDQGRIFYVPAPKAKP